MKLFSRKLWGDMLVFVLACVVAMVLVEGAVRLYLFGSLKAPRFSHDKLLSVPHAQRGSAFAPNESTLSQTLDYVVTSYTNDRGLNDTNTSYEKPEGVFRIITLGDSFMFAREVTRAQALPALLETALGDRNVEVINLSCVGYGTLQEYLFLVEEGFKYEPDLVVLAVYFMNDIRDNSKPLNDRMWGAESPPAWARPYAAWDPETGHLRFEFPDYDRLVKGHADRAFRIEGEYAERSFWSRTATGMLTANVLNNLLQRVRPPEYDPQLMFGPYATAGIQDELVGLWEDAWQITAQTIVEIAEVTRQHGAAFAVMSIPDRFQVRPDYRKRIAHHLEGLTIDLTRPEKRLEALGREHDFPVLDLTKPFQRAFEEDYPPLYYLLEDHHWTPAGHRLATQLLIEFLDSQSLLPAS